jgi:hypothetical protein
MSAHGSFQLTGLLLTLFTTAAEAKLPWGSTVVPARLKKSGEVSFDPLSVAAVLHNPRANASATNLYTQCYRELYHWPHATMMGGALTPVKVLVGHLLWNRESKHPASVMCMDGASKITIRSDTIFRQLPLDFSHSWVKEVLSRRPSVFPDNDFIIAYVDHIGGERVSASTWPKSIFIGLAGALNGMILMAGTAFSVLIGDIWAATLFLCYTCHWIASTLITFNVLVTPRLPQSPNEIREDGSIHYAVYQRDEGGTVIFKARKDVLETWARMAWDFDNAKRRNTFLHWFWILSGTMAAISSLACMVNMNGYLQLGFLGVLLYSSLAEIIITNLGRSLTDRGFHYGNTCPVIRNETRTKGIIRATIGVQGRCRAKDLHWIDLGLLPPLEIFRSLERLLDILSGLDPATDEKLTSDAIHEFRVNAAEKDKGLADRICKEVEGALGERVSGKLPTV